MSCLHRIENFKKRPFFDTFIIIKILLYYLIEKINGLKMFKKKYITNYNFVYYNYALLMHKDIIYKFKMKSLFVKLL